MGSWWQLGSLRPLNCLRLTSLDCTWQTTDLSFRWSAAGHETTGRDGETQFEARVTAYATQLQQYGVHVMDQDGKSLQPMVTAVAGS
jgi:hypothetical protein